MRAEYSAAARAELLEAAEYYEGRRPGLGGRFVEHVEAAVNRALKTPLLGVAIKVPGNDVVRLVRPAVFPYKLPFLIRGEVLVVLAIAHERREPRYWLDRL